MQISVRLENDDKVRLGLNKWAQAVERISRDDLRDAMRRAKKRSVSDPAGGPYSVPERGYVRTGNLSASTELIEDGLTFRIESNAMHDGEPYSVYVIGRADGSGQARIHQGWWTPLRTSVDDEIDDLVRDIDADLGQSAEAAGL